MTFLLLSVTCAVAVAALLGTRGQGPVGPVLKAIAATCFVAAALAAGSLGSPFGRWMAVGFGLSWCGDLLLIGRGRRPFVAGLVAFLLAHVAFTVAFAVRGASVPETLAAAAGLSLPAALVGRWLWPHLSPPMRGPVVAYVVAISAMVALSVGTAASRGNLWLGVGAIAFYLSDLAVARDRFVVQQWSNRVWGLPLYFGGQLVLAWCSGQP